MLSRHIDFNIHKVWLDEENCLATFPLWNLSGQLTGYQTYNPKADKFKSNDIKGRYYTYRNKKAVSIWGLESWNFSNTLFVTEGIFDASRLTEWGCSAVALLSNNPNQSVKSWFSIIRQSRPVVSVSDPGDGGKYLKKLSHIDVPCENTDLGDSPDWVVDKLVKNYK